MRKIALLAVMVGFLVFVRTGVASADQALDCYPIGYDDQSKRFIITCSWEDPDDCFNSEPAYDKCEEICSYGWPPLVNYNETGGDPCSYFYCRCWWDLN